MNGTVLVAEDNYEIAKLLKLYLEGSGYEVFVAEDGEKALEIAENQIIDIALLDIMMPKKDGYEVTKEIRQFSDMPVMFLTAKNEDNDKIIGLNIGADDYITKPFNPLEVVARVNAVLRRYNKLNQFGGEVKGVIRAGDLNIDTNFCKVYKGREEIPVTATEYKILLLLIKSPNKIFSKNDICEYLNGDYYSSDDKVITVHISHLREKLGNQYIITVKGLGYKLEIK